MVRAKLPEREVNLMESLSDGFEERMKKTLEKQEKEEQKRLLRLTDKKRVAYHEAGHAIVSYHFGDALDEISIEPNVDSMGRAKNKFKGLPNMSSSDIEERIIKRLFKVLTISLGGLVAEHIYDGEPKRLNKYGGSGRDLKEAQKVVFDVIKIQWSQQEIIDAIFHKAYKILKSKWRAVEALATALVQERIINGEEAVEIIKLKGGEPD